MQIETSGGVVRVTLPTALEQSVAESVEKAVLAALTPGVRAVLFDASHVEETTIFARTAFIRLQALIARQCRTSWLASRPRIRGYCQWICHVAEDPHARVHMTREQAEAWLNDGGERFASIEQRTASAIAAVKKGGAR